MISGKNPPIATWYLMMTPPSCAHAQAQCLHASQLSGYATVAVQGMASDLISLYEIQAAHKRLTNQKYQSLEDIFAGRRATGRQLSYARKLIKM
jgi:hypothetical protein